MSSLKRKRKKKNIAIFSNHTRMMQICHDVIVLHSPKNRIICPTLCSFSLEWAIILIFVCFLLHVHFYWQILLKWPITMLLIARYEKWHISSCYSPCTLSMSFLLDLSHRFWCNWMTWLMLQSDSCVIIIICSQFLIFASF